MKFKMICLLNIMLMSAANAAPSVFFIEEGSVYQNVSRAVSALGYQELVWKVSDPLDSSKSDFYWKGGVEISYEKPYEVFEQILAPFPVSAKVMLKNKVLCVTNHKSGCP